MRVTYDTDVDILYVSMDHDAPHYATREVNNDCMEDVDVDGNTLGVEFLHASQGLLYSDKEPFAKDIYDIQQLLHLIASR